MNSTIQRTAARPSGNNVVVTVEKITRLNSTGALRGFASVSLSDGKWRIHDLRIVQQDGQQAWVSMPQGSYERDGKKRYYPILEAPENIKAAIQDAVLAAWEAGE